MNTLTLQSTKKDRALYFEVLDRLKEIGEDPSQIDNIFINGQEYKFTKVGKGAAARMVGLTKIV